MEIDSIMDTLSTSTILNEPIPQKTYSQAVTGPSDTRRTQHSDLTALIARWTEQFRITLALKKNNSFDSTYWTRDRIIAAFDNPIELKALIKHKMQTSPTEENIPQAISLKFKHKDQAFFRTFTRRHDTSPPHQLEFQTLLNSAMDKYKRLYNAHLINKENRDQISDMLRKKLAIDFWTNSEFTKMDAYEIARHILYGTGFAKIKTSLSFDTIRVLAAEAFSELLLELPEQPDQIPKQIRDALPFKLPLTDRKQVRAAAITLRLIYKFERLPDSYINDNREKLPDLPGWLNDETRKLFPITSRSDLKKVFEYKQLLQKYYIFNRLPDSYFDLPPKKIQLPLTPQELTPSLREQFPFFPRNSEHFKTQITKLRTVYKFTRLPNDYLISKKRLPADPSNLTSVKHITFPITDTNTYLDFLQNIPRYYAIPEPLPEAYINFNYTNKPVLPTDPKLVEKVN